jgi:hypothetical protein
VPTLTVNIPELVALRLEALAGASGKTVDELAGEAFDAITGSFASRRAILKARNTASMESGGKATLADLGWLDGYTGQTVDELLLFGDTEKALTILQVLEEAIQAKGPRGRSGVERMVLSIGALVREVNNGGYDQFFRNSSRQFAPAIVSDLVRIGCTGMADLCQEALDALGLPEASVKAVEAAMEEENVERDRVLARCDIRFYELPSPADQLLAYVKVHQDGIRI